MHIREWKQAFIKYFRSGDASDGDWELLAECLLLAVERIDRLDYELHEMDEKIKTLHRASVKRTEE